MSSWKSWDVKKWGFKREEDLLGVIKDHFRVEEKVVKSLFTNFTKSHSNLTTIESHLLDHWEEIIINLIIILTTTFQQTTLNKIADLTEQTTHHLYQQITTFPMTKPCKWLTRAQLISSIILRKFHLRSCFLPYGIGTYYTPPYHWLPNHPTGGTWVGFACFMTVMVAQRLNVVTWWWIDF